MSVLCVLCDTMAAVSLYTVPIVEWDAVSKPKWDGAHHSSTVEQLTSVSHRSLGENGETRFLSLSVNEYGCVIPCSYSEVLGRW